MVRPTLHRIQAWENYVAVLRFKERLRARKVLGVIIARADKFKRMYPPGTFPIATCSVHVGEEKGFEKLVDLKATLRALRALQQR